MIKNKIVNLFNYKKNHITMSCILALFVVVSSDIFLLLSELSGAFLFPPQHFQPTQTIFTLQYLPTFLFYQVFLNWVFLFILFMLAFKILSRPNIKLSKKTIYLCGAVFTTLFFWEAIIFLLDNLIILIHNAIVEDNQDRPLVISPLVNGFPLQDTFFCVVVILSSLLSFTFVRHENFLLENEILKTENIRAKYDNLSAQLNPHFLFNSLNTLSGIVTINPQYAQEYIQQLATIFRYSLAHNDITTLEEELSFTQSYSEILMIRYDDNLKIEYNIDHKLMKGKVLPFSIQPLVENAVKHNTVTTKNKLLVTVVSEGDKIVVTNKKQPKLIPEPSSGVGLKNLQDRYKYQFDKEVEIIDTEDTFSVSIPVII